ncbi:amidohydrolase [Tumebacillus sp. ITR2]|uniref:Amidohydrolase n=1 Tax=Tumebacillus amylolyticus TaxID=2801339 RepID=A0ABS1J8E0_9BACL|nr:amidohydrolase [Tumebacillus amylolyticus]MBL0386519.1 amidohydrolase [Tumebacillus amylolyticus]
MTTIFTNARVYTMDSTQPRAEAIAVREGRILAVGSNADIRLQFASADAQVIDLDGATVLPGLIDNHLHVSNHGLKLSQLDFSNVTSAEDMLRLIREWAARAQQDEWVVGIGWNENNFADRHIPTLAELDEAAPHHPIFLTRICNHAFLTNTKGFGRAGVHSNSSDPSDGAYGRDEAGHFTGMIFENAYRPFRAAIPKMSYDELKSALRLGVQDALRHGLTSVHTEDLRYLGGWANTWNMYRELIVGEDLRLRANHLVYYEFLDEFIESGMTTGDGDEWVNVGAVKMFADGAMGGRTALMSFPYPDAPHTHGTAILSQDEMNDIARRAAAHGMPIAVHAIGDGATDIVLNAMEQNPVATHRHRLIHAQVLRPEQIERMKKFGDSLALDLQPRFVPSDFPWVKERIAEHYWPTSYAWKTLLEAGLLCGGGSDAPIEPIEPLLGIHAAVTRRKPNETHEGYGPEQKLSIEQALHLFTIGGTYATREEDVKGTITAGKFADLTILDGDIMTSEPDAILETNVIRTVIGGKTVFEN